MEYVKLSFSIKDDAKDMLIAKLSEMGYEGFEEAEEDLYAYIPEHLFIRDDADAVALAYDAPYSTENIPPQNWNATWESNFQPVVIEGICTIRADFHDIMVSTPYEIIITPKMSFGTGHHATTRLMMTRMNELNLKGKRVFDFGTGTGILAILAEQMGATHVVATDNDEWSYTNAKENAERNNCSNIDISLTDIHELKTDGFDVILANINRHILLHYMVRMKELCMKGGTILMSGLLVEDEEIIVEAATKAGMKFMDKRELNGWICLLFVTD